MIFYFTMNFAVFLLISVIFICFQECHTYITLGRNINSCQNPSNTEAIEHFFNLIFTEFHNIPPACICVQMCIEHPTYCYPNGCLKRPEKEKKCPEIKPVVDSVNVKSSRTPKSVMFLVENHDNFVDDMNNYAEEIATKTQPKQLIYRPNPFKELVLKYKRIPKLQMRYNLREQVKNMKYDKLKRDQIDVSKTRWPINRHLMHGMKPVQGIRYYKKNDEKRHSKFLASMFPELANEKNYAPKFYNKYLTKRENNDGVNVESLYLYKADAANFSLETLIDSLIENTLDWSKIKNNSNISNESEIDNISRISYRQEPNQIEINNNNSINSTNVTIDSNNFLPNTNKTHEKGYLKMIAIMSEEIDKQNKVSLDLMERVNSDIESVEVFKNVSTLHSTSQGMVGISREGDNTSSRIVDNNIITTYPSIDESLHDIPSTTSRNVHVPMMRTPVKSKQRIVRKLKNKSNKL